MKERHDDGRKARVTKVEPVSLTMATNEK